MRIRTAVAVGAMCLLLAASALGQTAETVRVNAKARTITVHIEGRATAKPDVGYALFSVSSAGPIASNVLAQQTERVNAVVAGLKGLDAPDSRVEASAPEFGDPSEGEGFGIKSTVLLAFGIPDASDPDATIQFTTQALDVAAKLGATPEPLFTGGG